MGELAQVVAAQLRDAIVLAHQQQPTNIVTVSARDRHTIVSVHQEAGPESPQAVRDKMRAVMSNAQATAAYTMGTSFLELIDVGAVADLVLVAFRWPHTGDKQYCYVQSITELSR